MHKWRSFRKTIEEKRTFMRKNDMLGAQHQRIHIIMNRIRQNIDSMQKSTLKQIVDHLYNPDPILCLMQSRSSPNCPEFYEAGPVHALWSPGRSSSL